MEIILKCKDETKYAKLKSKNISLKMLMNVHYLKYLWWLETWYQSSVSFLFIYFFTSVVHCWYFHICLYRSYLSSMYSTVMFLQLSLKNPQINHHVGLTGSPRSYLFKLLLISSHWHVTCPLKGKSWGMCPSVIVPFSFWSLFQGCFTLCCSDWFVP